MLVLEDQCIEESGTCRIYIKALYSATIWESSLFIQAGLSLGEKFYVNLLITSILLCF